MNLKDLILELFAENGKFEFNDLLAQDKKRLSEAYIRENEDIIFDLFANVHITSLAGHFAELVHSVEQCDVFAMAEDIRNAIVGSNDLQVLIDGEIDRWWPSYEAERRETQREAQYDNFREAI